MHGTELNPIVNRWEESGLPRLAFIRLCIADFTMDDLKTYWETEHFKQVRSLAIRVYKSCVMCDVKNCTLTAHHRHYRTLFREHILTDVSCICSRCHALYETHKRRRRR